MCETFTISILFGTHFSCAQHKPKFRYFFRWILNGFLEQICSMEQWPTATCINDFEMVNDFCFWYELNLNENESKSLKMAHYVEQLWTVFVSFSNQISVSYVLLCVDRWSGAQQSVRVCMIVFNIKLTKK